MRPLRKKGMLKTTILDEQKSLVCPIQLSISGSAIEDNTVSRCKKMKTVNQEQDTSSALG